MQDTSVVWSERPDDTGALGDLPTSPAGSPNGARVISTSTCTICWAKTTSVGLEVDCPFCEDSLELAR
jgi:hypothetical protein